MKYQFRGYEIATRKYVYGDLIHLNGAPYIYDGVYHRVKEFGISQYVGDDANGERIFVGDVVEVEGVNRKFRACLKGMAFSEDGCYLSESQLKNSRKVSDERINNS